MRGDALSRFVGGLYEPLWLAEFFKVKAAVFGSIDKNAMSKAETKNSTINMGLWALSLVLVAAGIYGNVYFGGESLLYRVLGLLVVAIVAGLVALQTVEGTAFWLLLKGARTEIRKVVWPTRQETMQTSLLVLAVVVVVGFILWGLDTLLGWSASQFIG